MWKSLTGRIVRFLALFVGLYAAGYWGYQTYRSQYADHQDPATQLVTYGSLDLANWLSDSSFTSTPTPSDGYYVTAAGQERAFVKIVEGCNGIAVIILFMSFVVAIAQGPLRYQTLRAAAIGALLLYGINLLRVALLMVWMHSYPQAQDLLHDIVFPGIIYGSVIVLWLLWIRIDLRHG